MNDSSLAPIICVCIQGLASPLHLGVFVSGHFNDLAMVAFLPFRVFPQKAAGAAVSPTAKSLK